MIDVIVQSLTVITLRSCITSNATRWLPFSLQPLQNSKKLSHTRKVKYHIHKNEDSQDSNHSGKILTTTSSQMNLHGFWLGGHAGRQMS